MEKVKIVEKAFLNGFGIVSFFVRVLCLSFVSGMNFAEFANGRNYNSKALKGVGRSRIVFCVH